MSAPCWRASCINLAAAFPQISGCLYWWKTSKSVPLLPLAPLEAKRKTAEGEERKEDSKQQRLFWKWLVMLENTLFYTISVLHMQGLQVLSGRSPTQGGPFKSTLPEIWPSEAAAALGQ